MGWLEWVVLALLAAWLAVSLWRMLHHRGLLRLLRRLHALPGRPAEKTDKGGCGRIPFCFDIRRKMCYTFPVLA